MENTIVLQVVAALVSLLFLHHQEAAAAADQEVGGNNNSSSIHGVLAVDASHTEMMQLVRGHHARRFSYCLRNNDEVPVPHGHLRFDGEVPNTSGMPGVHLLYNDNHDADYGPYFVELDGVSVAGAPLPGVNADTFRRNEADGSGGTVLNVGAPLLVMVHAAYAVLEHAVAEHIRPLGLPHVHRTGYSFCFRGATNEVWRRLPSAKLHFGGESGAEIWLPPRKLFGEFGQDTCLGVVPGDRTIIGAWTQGNTRLTFDLDDNVVFIRPENCQLDTALSVHT